LPWGPLALTAAAVAGILSGERAGPASVPALLALGIAGCLVALLLRAGGVRVALAAIGIAVLATAVTQRALDGVANSPLTRPTVERASVRITGALVDDPSGAPYFASVLVRVTSLEQRPAGHRAVLVTARGEIAERLRLLEAGDQVELVGWLEPLTGFDARLRWRHVVAHLHAVELVSFAPPTSPVLRVANELRHRVLAGGLHLPATERALVAGFLLGDTRQLPERVEEQFRAAGMTHLLAVSGANVAFVLAVVAPILRRLSLRLQLAGGLVVIVLFGTMTRWEPSVLRACVMAACSMVALYLGRPSAGVRILALATLMLLLADPFLLHSVGFLLSVGASAGIVLLGQRFASSLPGPRMVREGLGITLAAQIGVAPVLIPVFGSVPLASLPANLLAVPLAAPLTVWGLVSGLAGGLVEPWWPSFAAVLQLPTLLLARVLLRIAAVFSQMDLAVDGRAAWGLIALVSLLAALRLRPSLEASASEPMSDGGGGLADRRRKGTADGSIPPR
jgi:competence protein ComEC